MPGRAPSDPDTPDGNAMQFRNIITEAVKQARVLQDEKEPDLRRKLTLTEVGVIVAILMSVGSLMFTGGVVYGQVQANTSRIAKVETKTDLMTADLAEIKANVEFLTELAREEREKAK